MSELNTQIVKCSAGEFRGRDGNDVVIFKGIPYALPPIGPARWTPPRPMPDRDSVYDAGDFGPACIQPPRKAESIFAGDLPGESEDCLSLNIWAPENAEKAPVLVWIHGGGFVWGAGSEKLYDGEALASQGTIVITINYRLGIFGYLAHPELSAESPDGISGNYGLLDQIEALKWINRNIAAFGGDPNNVTIAGESAGALSVVYLMASPKARGLFAKAIAQSAYMKSTPELRDARFGERPAEQSGLDLAAKLGATNIADLRAMDAQHLAVTALQAGFVAEGTIDGHLLPRQLVEIFDRGEQAPVPLLVGFNSGETRIFPFMIPPLPENADQYETEMRNRNGELVDRFLALYPSSDLKNSLLATARDAVYGWTAERLAIKQTASGLPAFLYFFDHGYPETDARDLHGFHGCELPFLFGTNASTPPRWPRAMSRQSNDVISKAMPQFWTSFAASGTPKADEQTNWHPYGADRAYMRFADIPIAATHLFPGMFELHEDVVQSRKEAGDIPWNWNTGIATPPMSGGD